MRSCILHIHLGLGHDSAGSCAGCCARMGHDPESQEAEAQNARHRLEGTGSSTGALLAALGVALCPLCFGFTMGFTS